MSVLVRILFLLIYTLEAEAALSFKKDAMPSMQWMPYCIAIIILLMILWGLAKYVRPKTVGMHKAKILDTVAIHNKTKAYVLDYQGQHFLIAENQNAIAIHAFKQGDSLA